MPSLFENAHSFNITSGKFSDVVSDDLIHHNRRYKPVHNYNNVSNVNAGIVYSSSSNYISKYADRPPWETENVLMGPSNASPNPWSSTPLGTPRNPYSLRREDDWSDIPYRRFNSQERPFTTRVSSNDIQAWTVNSYNTSLNQYSNVNNDYAVVNINASPLPTPAMRQPSPRPYVSDYSPSRSPLRPPVTISDDSRAVPALLPVPPAGLSNASTDQDVPIRGIGALGLTIDPTPSSSTPTEELKKETSQDPPTQASQPVPVQSQSSEQPPRDPLSKQDPQPQLQDQPIKPPEQLPSEQSSQPRQPEDESVEHAEQEKPLLEQQSTTVSDDTSNKAGSNTTLSSDEEKKDPSSKSSRSTSPKPKKREFFKKLLHLGDKSTGDKSTT